MIKLNWVFIDGNKNRVEIESEVITRNWYNEYTSICTVNWHGWQAFDHIAPATEEQKDILLIHECLHLRNLDKLGIDISSFETNLRRIYETFKIEPKEWKVPDVHGYETSKEKLETIKEYFSIQSREDFKEEVTQEEDNRFSIQWQEWLVCTDEEAEEELDVYLDDLFEEVVLQEIPERYRKFIDKEARKRTIDERSDIAMYDWQELRVGNFYFYRQN